MRDVKSQHLSSRDCLEMRKYFPLALALGLLLVCVNSVGALQEEEEDEGWPRPLVVKALLLHIENIAHNCSLAMIDSKYPVLYPDGRGSSHQFVVGCLPTSTADLNNKNYLWQIQEVHSEVNLIQYT